MARAAVLFPIAWRISPAVSASINFTPTVRKPIDFGQIISRSHGAGGEAERRRCPGGNKSSFGAGQLGETTTRLFLQLMDPDEVTRGIFHCLFHFRGHQSPA